MIWSLDQDDYTGLFCNRGSFPLTRLVHKLLLNTTNVTEHDFESSTAHQSLPTKQLVSITFTQQLTSTEPILFVTKTSTQITFHNQSTKMTGWFYVVIIVLLLNRM
jgi:predicted secreted acid phosphatase